MEELKAIAPSVAISVSKQVDESFKWDGDGPDPKKSGYFPHDVTVSARLIHCGQFVEACAYLGGSYYRKDQTCGEVNGYLPQMVEEALSDLAKKVSGSNPQIESAIAHMERVMQQKYAAQRAEFEANK